MPKILVIDDEQDILALLERYLAKHGFKVDTATTAKAGLEKLRKDSFDLVISDFRLPDMNGLELLKYIKGHNLQLNVIIITGYSDIRMAVEVIKYGAVDYLTKPLYPEELLVLINETLQKALDLDPKESATPKTKNRTATRSSAKPSEMNFILGKSPSSQHTQLHIEMVAPTPMTVVITGETGTGKEYVARKIHELSSRSDQAFVAIDCGALPKDIAGSEFFGHEQGAFTGAVKAKDGKFKLAHGGTLFLDEVGNLPYDVQIKLLRVLQERKFTKVGGNADIEVDVRVLAATNENLKDAVKDGRFREDLYYRLNEFSLDLAPLRARNEDLNDFVEAFIRQANEMLGKNVEGLSKEVWRKFSNYSWPGNLRELRNVIKRAVLLSEGRHIGLEALPKEITYHREETMGNGTNGTDTLKSAAESAEREKIVNVLNQTGNNKSKAARLLNIDRKTLYNKLKIYGI